MNNIALGSYLPLDSLVHKMDPRTKIAAMVAIMVCIFLPVGPKGYGVLMVLVVGVVLLSKLKIGFILKAMKPMMFMMIFLLVINVFVIKTGDLLLSLSFFQVYSDAIFQTLFIVVRLLLMISITTILTATTKPLDLTLGIEELLTPFKKIGVPAHIIAMMISIALRFIPTLIEETSRIMKAQASRGVDFEEGKLMEKIRGITSLIIPLFISALQKAEDLSNAMEARGYSPDNTRTRYKVLKMQRLDYVTMLGSLVLLAGFVVATIL